ncbi:hypothetical protein GHT06_020283 [Daphnia sinensis]|uniref:Uncharacterized protein n=1 Tax=Daphnia sinensis TaxID=1820382 RepID=A0AAD5KLW8_9CRUS|nr:hypothetical protein GHT06_020283 [Daphnia sinensis]
MEWKWKYRDKTDTAFRAVDITIEGLQQLVERLSGGGETERRVSKRCYGKNLPALFPPAQMQAVIAEIKTQLPNGWALTPATQAGDMWKSYQEAAVTAATIENGVRLFIHIPIFEFTRALTLYRVISLARATTNGSTSLQYVGLPQYVVTSIDHETFIELSAEMVGPCHLMKKSICPISRAVSWKKSKGACSVAIFLADDHRIKEDCIIIVTPWTGQEAVYLGHRRWGLSATNATRLIIPMACTAQSDDWIFQASFRKAARRQWITRTTSHLADLKTPGQPPQLPMTTTKDDMSAQHTGSRTGSNDRLKEMTTGMVHQMIGLSNLEHARLNIDDPQTRTLSNRLELEQRAIKSIA